MTKDPMRDESYHPEWTLSPLHHAVLKDMRKAGEQRRQREQQAATPADCDCHDRMGNDFYFLPKGQCLKGKCDLH